VKKVFKFTTTTRSQTQHWSMLFQSLKRHQKLQITSSSTTTTAATAAATAAVKDRP
jgi:hypothetical protein